MARTSHHAMAAQLREVSGAVPGGFPDNWVGGANGNGDWNTGADWTSGVPAASATATFATGDQGYTVTGDATIGGILVNGDGVTFDGAVTQDSTGGGNFLTGINGADVTLDSNAFFDGQGFDFEDGTLLDVQGTLLTTGGVADVLLVDGLNADLISSGAVTANQLYVQEGGSFTGDVVLTDGGNVTLDTSSNFGGGSLTLQGSATLYEALAAGGTTGSGSIADNIAFAAGGSTLNLAADPGATLLVSGNITGNGSLVVSGGTVELTGANTYTGGTDVQYGTLQVDTAASLPSSLVILSGGALVTEPLATGVLKETVVAAAGSSDTVNAVGGNDLVYGRPGRHHLHRRQRRRCAVRRQRRREFHRRHRAQQPGGRHGRGDCQRRRRRRRDLWRHQRTRPVVHRHRQFHAGRRRRHAVHRHGIGQQPDRGGRWRQREP
jgi:autotransporter-associated beta strand protein